MQYYCLYFLTQVKEPSFFVIPTVYRSGLRSFAIPPLIDDGGMHSQLANKRYWTRITSDDCVGREKHHAFHNGLRIEHPAERIFVKRRKDIAFHGARARDGKLGVAVV